MTKKIFHEFNLNELPDLRNQTVPEYNDALYKLYLEIAKFNGGKLVCLIAGPGADELLVNLSGNQKELKDEEFYKMGNHGAVPIFVDKSLGRGDILVVCKYGTEKIRVQGI
jgi:hypothetical protein